MHILPEALKRPSDDRLESERAFKWVNRLLIFLQLGCILYAISVTNIAAQKTFDSSIWESRQLRLDVVVQGKTVNCTEPITASLGAFTDISVNMSKYNFLYFLAEFTYSVKFVIIINCVVVCAGAFNKVLFDLNIFKFQHVYLVIRKDLLTSLEVMMLVTNLVGLTGIDADAGRLRTYLEACGVENQNTLPYAAPYAELYVSVIATLVFHGVCALLHVYNSRRDDLQPRGTEAIGSTYASEPAIDQELPPPAPRTQGKTQQRQQPRGGHAPKRAAPQPSSRPPTGRAADYSAPNTPARLPPPPPEDAEPTYY